MATALPQTNFNFSTLDFRSEDTVLFDQSIGKRSFARAIGGQCWAFTGRYQLLTNAQFRQLGGVLATLRGPLNELTVKPPVIKDTAGTDSITSVTVNGASQTGSSINVALTGASGGGIHVTGDFFTIGSDAKVYQLTADIDTGNTSISFFPPLVSSPSNGATLNFSDVTWTMRMVNKYAFQGVQPNHFIVELDMIESF